MSQRNLRRIAGKKNANDLAATLHTLKEMTTGIRDVLPGAHRDLLAAQEAAVGLVGGKAEIAALQYQLDRQRAVFIRLLNNMVVGGNIAELLALEEEYGAEYDAMRFFAWVATLAVEPEEP